MLQYLVSTSWTEEMHPGKIQKRKLNKHDVDSDESGYPKIDIVLHKSESLHGTCPQSN